MKIRNNDNAYTGPQALAMAQTGAIMKGDTIYPFTFNLGAPRGYVYADIREPLSSTMVWNIAEKIGKEFYEVKKESGMVGYDDRYLGDGVYATFDGFGITLDLRAQSEANLRDASNTIYLEPEIIVELQKFIEEVIK